MEIKSSSSGISISNDDDKKKKKNKDNSSNEKKQTSETLNKNHDLTLKVKKDDLGQKLDLFPNKTEEKPKTIFKSESEKSNAQKYLDRMSGNAFDPVRTVEDRFLNLKRFSESAFSGNVNKLPFSSKSPSVDLDDLKGINSYSDLADKVRESVKNDPNAQKVLGSNPTEAQVNEYIQNNLNSIAQNMGNDIPYDGYLSFLGDSTGFQALNDGYGVCTDIHASITALRRAFGQEAYLVMTTGSDAAHVFTVFKENGKWNIQNYEGIYQTDAQTVSELYDQYMPEQRKIKIYEVASDGNIKQVTTDHLTATGLAENRFRNEAGVGNFNPWVSEDGLTLGNTEISFAKNGGYIGINPTDNSIKAAYYKKTEKGDTQTIQGGAIEGQYLTTPGGYERKRVDAKYEFEKKYDNAEKQVYGRSHFSVHAGTEAVPEPLYWQDLSDGGTSVSDDDIAVRLGVSYHRNDSKLYGKSPVKFELGHQTKVGVTGTISAKDPTDPAYAGRMYGDIQAESKLVTGVFIQPTKDLTIRTGLASGVDLAKIDGIKQPLEQLKNVAESDAYVDVQYSKGPVALTAMGMVPLHNPSQYKAGGGIAITPTKELVIGATYIHEKIVNDNIDSIRLGAEYRPVENVAIGVNLSTPVIGDTVKNVRAEGYLKIKF